MAYFNSLLAAPYVEVTTYGAAANATEIQDGTIAGGSLSTLTSASNGFANALVGQTIVVAGAGAAGATLVTTIASVDSAGSLDLTAAASGAVTGVEVIFGTDDTTAIQAAINALPGAGGVVLFPARSLCTGTLTTTSHKNSVTFRGLAGRANIGKTVNNLASNLPASCLVYTGTTSPFIDCTQTHGVTFESLGVHTGNSAFAGTLIDLSASSSTLSSTLNRIHDCTIGSMPNPALTTSGSVGVLGLRNYNLSVVDTFFYGMDIQYRGMSSPGSSFNNNTKFIGCYFTQYGTVAIRNASEATAFIACGFEGSLSGPIAALDFEASDTIDGLLFAGCFFADVGTSSGAWIKIGDAQPRANLSGGLVITGCRMTGGANSAVVRLTANNWFGIAILGGQWDGGNLIDFGTTTGHKNVVIAGVGLNSAQGMFAGTLPTAGDLHYDGWQGRIKAGAAADADWTGATPAEPAPPDGTIKADSSAISKLWVRIGGAWKSVTVA